MCDLSNKMYIDISKVYEPDDGRWDKSDWETLDQPSKAMKDELAGKVGHLIHRLKQLDCHPRKS